MKPSQVVAGLDRYIVGQADAKRAVAIAMRNRWRRQRIVHNDALKRDIVPRNVLLVGPTGCGKTEVARRMASLNHSPFLKVEATKFTEVGYHGRDVDSIIRDLMDVSMQLTRKQWTEKLRETARAKVNDKILNQLAGPTANAAGEAAKHYHQRNTNNNIRIVVVTPDGASSSSTFNSSSLDEEDTDTAATTTTTTTGSATTGATMNTSSTTTEDSASSAATTTTADDVAGVPPTTNSAHFPSSADDAAELDFAPPPPPQTIENATANNSSNNKSNRGRESFRAMLEDGMLDDQEIEVEIPKGGLDRLINANNNSSSTNNNNGNSDMLNDSPGGAGGTNIAAVMAELLARVSSTGGGSGNKRGAPTERTKMPISMARNVIMELELAKMLDEVDLKQEAITAVEQSGIVFIDEIDKICTARDHSHGRSADASAEGVQRDLLPLIEGTVISTKYGNVNTDYILFIASGAFHAVKPSDLLPELQGRLPIRVELQGLSEHDLYRILTEPVSNLVVQQIALIQTEGVTLEFDDAALREIARMAAHLNKAVENIGARRLHTVMERIMEEMSFAAAEMPGGSVLRVDKALVERRLSDIVQNIDVSKYIL